MLQRNAKLSNVFLIRRHWETKEDLRRKNVLRLRFQTSSEHIDTLISTAARVTPKSQSFRRRKKKK